jgi:hypothetical protein
MNQPNVRAIFLEFLVSVYPGNLQSTSVLEAIMHKLGPFGRTEVGQQAILTAFHDLFRTGYLAWGSNLSNPGPPHFHITDQARRALSDISRDPANPDGYLENLRRTTQLSAICQSYISEAVSCYVADLPKSAAVMVGAAAEGLALELRDMIVNRMTALGRTVPKGLAQREWSAKTILDAIREFLQSNKAVMGRPLWEAVEAYWPAYTQQIRAARNEAGHPNSIDPVTIDIVHGSLLIFPELAKLAGQLKDWLSTAYGPSSP